MWNMMVISLSPATVIMQWNVQICVSIRNSRLISYRISPLATTAETNIPLSRRTRTNVHTHTSHSNTKVTLLTALIFRLSTEICLWRTTADIECPQFSMKQLRRNCSIGNSVRTWTAQNSLTFADNGIFVRWKCAHVYAEREQFSEMAK